MRIAIFPGSFDPVTLGHVDIVKRAVPLFDKIIIALGINSTKQTMFTPEQRLRWLEQTFSEIPNTTVISYEGLTVDFCKKNNASYILRGLRSGADYQFEKAIAQMNRLMTDQIETVFLLSTPELAPISSTIIRDIYKNKGDISRFVPSAVQP